MDINTFNFISTTSVSPLSTKLKRHSICVFYLLKSFQLKSCLLWFYFNPNSLLMRPKKVVLICKNKRNNDSLKNGHFKVIGQNHYTLGFWMKTKSTSSTGTFGFFGKGHCCPESTSNFNSFRSSAISLLLDCFIAASNVI